MERRLTFPIKSNISIQLLTAKAFFAQNGKVNLGGEIVVAKLCTAFEVSTRVI